MLSDITHAIAKLDAHNYVLHGVLAQLSGKLRPQAGKGPVLIWWFGQDDL